MEDPFQKEYGIEWSREEDELVIWMVAILAKVEALSAKKRGAPSPTHLPAGRWRAIVEFLGRMEILHWELNVRYHLSWHAKKRFCGLVAGFALEQTTLPAMPLFIPLEMVPPGWPDHNPKKIKVNITATGSERRIAGDVEIWNKLEGKVEEYRAACIGESKEYRSSLVKDLPTFKDNPSKYNHVQRLWDYRIGFSYDATDDTFLDPFMKIRLPVPFGSVMEQKGPGYQIEQLREVFCPRPSENPPNFDGAVKWDKFCGYWIYPDGVFYDLSIRKFINTAGGGFKLSDNEDGSDNR
ncbi:hypothetical protein DSL72_008067 [Monilinia vaccinii-corymbosi]|uniref:Uncharacterized protein n=1 Tax=Monilinia vaccinii-corymbosi TaxID=61207 RepID=A0A8A3PJE6_9HELO|nr:hypothetical protein DSL72_008067 [Monilinia vaccinii-corymbosi]